MGWMLEHKEVGKEDLGTMIRKAGGSNLMTASRGLGNDDAKSKTHWSGGVFSCSCCQLPEKQRAKALPFQLYMLGEQSTRNGRAATLISQSYQA